MKTLRVLAALSKATPAPSRSTMRAVQLARLHRRYGNEGAYARTLAGEHRAVSARQQRAIEAVIAADATGHLFTRHPTTACLIAVQS